MKRVSTIFWGLIIIVVGIIFLGNNLEFWNINIFFNGWWALFIIIPSFYSLLKGEWVSSFLGIFIGVLLLLAAQDFIRWDMAFQMFMPLLLITIGLSLVFKPKFSEVKINKKGLPEYVGIFSGSENIVKDKFEGASLVAVFGGVDLNLQDAKIEKDIVINCVSVFGGIDIKLPKNVKVKTSGVPIFGGLENKAIQEEGPTVVINYVCVFGGTDIK